MAKLRVGDLPPAEHQRHLDLVFFLEEAARVARFRLEVVILDPRTILHLLEMDHVLLLLRQAGLLGLLELELSEVHDPDDRRTRRWRDLDQVQTSLFRQREGLVHLHDAELAPVMTNYPNGT